MRREADRGPSLHGHGALTSGEVDETVVGRIFREEYGRCVAGLVRAFGDIDLAEDGVQEAFAVALDRWTTDGLPPNPGAWIATTARNRTIDRLRRAARGSELERAAASFHQTDDDDARETGPVDDDL